MTKRARPAAFTAQCGLIPKRDVQHSAFAAVHRIEPERFASAFNIVSRSLRTDTQFRDPDRPVIIGVK